MSGRQPIKEQKAEYNFARARASFPPPSEVPPRRTAQTADVERSTRPPVQHDTVDDEDVIYPTRTPNSTRRYASTTPPRTEIQVTHHPPTRRPSAPPPTRRVHWLVPLGVGMLVMLILWQGGSLGLSWWQSYQNDLHYGRPRTTQVDAKVGHNDSQTPSHFIAVNLAGHIVVVEFPGGDAAHAKVSIGPIMAPGHELDPVTLTFKDVNGDGKPDMIVAVGEVREVFINDHGSFRPMRAGEQVNL
jgi:hypothetical protein